MCLFATDVSSLVKYLFRSHAYFKSWSVFLWAFKSYFFLDISSFSEV